MFLNVEFYKVQNMIQLSQIAYFQFCTPNCRVIYVNVKRKIYTRNL